MNKSIKYLVLDKYLSEREENLHMLAKMKPTR